MKNILILILLFFISSCATKEKQGIIIPSQNKLKVIFSDNDSDKDENIRINKRFHFSIMENGKNDLLYFGVRFGGVYPQVGLFTSKKEIEIQLYKKNQNGDISEVWTGAYKGSLLYSSTIIDMGDIISKKEIDDYKNKYYIHKIVCTTK